MTTIFIILLFYSITSFVRSERTRRRRRQRNRISLRVRIKLSDDAKLNYLVKNYQHLSHFKFCRRESLKCSRSPTKCTSILYDARKLIGICTSACVCARSSVACKKRKKWKNKMIVESWTWIFVCKFNVKRCCLRQTPPDLHTHRKNFV